MNIPRSRNRSNYGIGWTSNLVGIRDEMMLEYYKKLEKEMENKKIEIVSDRNAVLERDRPREELDQVRANTLVK